MTNYFDLAGKVALVTGGSRGLGYQMVKALRRARRRRFHHQPQAGGLREGRRRGPCARPQGATQAGFCFNRRQLA